MIIENERKISERYIDKFIQCSKCGSKPIIKSYFNDVSGDKDAYICCPKCENNKIIFDDHLQRIYPIWNKKNKEKLNIKYEISNFMSLEEFEEYIRKNIESNIKTRNNEDIEDQKKYFLLIMKHEKFDKLISCNIYTYKDLQLIPIDDRESDYPKIYNINEMKHTIMCESNNRVEYYIALEENEKVMKNE